MSNLTNAYINTTRAERIRAAMFSESDDHNRIKDLSSSIEYTPGKSTAVQKLTQSSHLLKSAVVDIINYKEDAEITEKALPELIRLLNDNDPIVSGQAALILHTLAKKEASRLALSTPQLIDALIQAFSNPKANDQTHQSIAGILYCLSQQKQGLHLILREGGIPLLIKLLDSSTESVVNYALSTLHHLLLNFDQSKYEILRYGGCQKLVHLLNSTDLKFLAILVDCLHMLAYNNDEVKIIIESSQGPQKLLNLLKLTDYEKLLWTITRLLRVLSCSPPIKLVLVSKNAIGILEKQLYHPISLRIQQNCLQILRNLSDQAVNLENLDSLIQLILKFLQTNYDPITKSCAIGILSNLTCNNQYNKMVLVQLNGVQILLNLIKQTSNDEDIIEPAICALRHITCRHSYATEAQDAVRKLNGLLLIVNLIDPTTYPWPIVKSTMNLIRNLGLSNNNLPILRQTNAIEKLTKLLIQTYEQYENTEFIDNYVRTEDIIEGCLSALHVIAKDQQNKIVIRDLDCIPLVVRLLYSPSNLSIQRAATGLLCELANDCSCAQIIEQQNSSEILSDLLQSNDEAIATYSAAILFHLSGDKSAYHDDQHSSTTHNYSPNGRIGLNSDVPTISYYASEGSNESGLHSFRDKPISKQFDSDL